MKHQCRSSLASALCLVADWARQTRCSPTSCFRCRSRASYTPRQALRPARAPQPRGGVLLSR
eukprot:4280948-Prymnesium_polylepis.1